MQMQIIKDELLEIKEKYGDERRSEIVYASEEFNPEDFYADDDMVITISHMGYIKRTPLAEYRTQNRGGVGAKGGATRDEDFIEHIYVASMHNTMLFFTEKGRCFWLKVYEIPEGARSSKGRAIQNVIQIEPDDKVRAYINVKSLADAEYVNNNYIIMCTKDGTIKKTKLEAYSRPRQNGVNAIVIREGDQLIEAKLTSGNAEVMIAARDGKAIRFNESTVRPIGRVGAGVRGISIEDGDEVVGMICVEPDSKQDVLVLSENGYGKRTDLDEYRITNRGGKGVKTINITEKTGKLISIQAVTDDNDLMIINRSGLTIRTAVSQIRLAGRATQGVRIINLREGDAIASVMAVPAAGEEEEVQPAEGVETGGETPEPPPRRNKKKKQQNFKISVYHEENDFDGSCGAARGSSRRESPESEQGSPSCQDRKERRRHCQREEGGEGRDVARPRQGFLRGGRGTYEEHLRQHGTDDAETGCRRTQVDDEGDAQRHGVRRMGVSLFHGLRQGQQGRDVEAEQMGAERRSQEGHRGLQQGL